MENIPRDLPKEITALQSSQPTRKNKRWTLLLVGDHGKVVTIRWFRWIITLWVSLLVLAAMVSGTLYYLYRHTSNVNVSLKRSLDNIQQQIVGLHSDKEVLMAKLVVAGAEMERLRARMDPKQVEKGPGNWQEARGQEAPPSNRQNAQESEAAVSGQEGKLLSGAPSAEPVVQETDPKVSIEEFNVSHEGASDTYRVKFVIRNTGSDSNKVSGSTAVILKQLNTQPDEWLTLPTLKLSEGLPTGDKKGQYFSIVNFKPVGFRVKSTIEPQLFNSATVFVFDNNGNLLLEKNFSINIQENIFIPKP